MRPCRSDQENDRHDDEHHGIRGFGIKDLGQAFHHPEHEAGDDRAQDRSHAADHHHRENDGDDVRAHARTNLIDRGRKYARKGRKRDAEAIGQGDHARHVDAEGAHHSRILGRRPEICAELGLLDHEPGSEADDRGRHDHPAPVDRQEHETEIERAGELLRNRIGHARRAEVVLEQALKDERQAKGQQQTVEGIEAHEALQEQALDDRPNRANRERREHQGPPVVEPRQLQQKISAERAHHVEGAVGEIDDRQQAEDDCET
jgi:hypothetical protein